jgi:hypothetical protein
MSGAGKKPAFLPVASGKAYEPSSSPGRYGPQVPRRPKAAQAWPACWEIAPEPSFV